MAVALATAPEPTSISEDREIQPLRAVSAPAVVLTDYCKGVCQCLHAVKTQLLSGREQPVFYLLPAFLLLGM